MGKHDHQFCFAQSRPSGDKSEKEEAEKQYRFMNLARLRINEEITNQKAAEHQISLEIKKFSDLDEEIERKMEKIKNLERWDLGKVEPSLPINSIPRTAGFFHFPGKDAQTMMIRPDLKRCQKRMIKKERMDKEYLQQVQEQLLCSKQCIGMTSCGTQELNNTLNSMEQRIQHGNKKRADEMKIFHEISSFKETKEVYNAPETNPYSDHWYTRERKSKLNIERKRSIEHKINILLDDIERLKRQQIGREAKITRLKAELVLVRKKISCLEMEYKIVNTKRLEAYKRGYELGEQKKELAFQSNIEK